ncbi:MAG: 50S ribosomal protein L25/general stress protein Ctc [Methylobacillus sp.]|jgi:large subunit ribosomal protein L25|nr:50S ribosomal protein L25/general stress protein Ctc [Methylobacillus sp.]
MQIEINAKKREAQGTGASRRLRRAGTVPGIVYGAGKNAVSIELNHRELFLQFRHEAFHASILNLNLDGKKEQVLLRDYQMHPVRSEIQHIDFQRVSATEKIHVKIPFHFINQDTAPGVKLGHGIVNHVMTEVEITCLPKNLPEFIEVDLGALELGQTIHLSQVTLPEGVEFAQLAHGADAAVVSLPVPRGGADEEEAAAPAAGEAAPTAAPKAEG